MNLDFFEKPLYGQKAAEVWKEVTGNYPFLPSSEEGGSVLLNSGNNQLHLVGFFGFQNLPDQVLVFESFLEAEQFYQNARQNPQMFRSRAPQVNILEEHKDKEIETISRPKFQYEGSGSEED